MQLQARTFTAFLSQQGTRTGRQYPCCFHICSATAAVWPRKGLNHPSQDLSPRHNLTWAHLSNPPQQVTRRSSCSQRQMSAGKTVAQTTAQ